MSCLHVNCHLWGHLCAVKQDLGVLWENQIQGSCKQLWLWAVQWNILWEENCQHCLGGLHAVGSHSILSPQGVEEGRCDQWDSNKILGRFLIKEMRKERKMTVEKNNQKRRWRDENSRVGRNITKPHKEMQNRETKGGQWDWKAPTSWGAFLSAIQPSAYKKAPYCLKERHWSLHDPQQDFNEIDNKWVEGKKRKWIFFCH